MHVLCFTRGEASTLNERDADLSAVRAEELRHASAELGVASCTLRDYPDGGLAAVPRAELETHVTALAARHGADGLLVFDDTGITGHHDHQAPRRRPSARPGQWACRCWPGCSGCHRQPAGG